MRVEPRFPCRHRDAIGERETEKDLEIDDAVHGATCSLNRFLERIHCAGDVFFEGVGYENMILIGIAVIGTSSGEVIDPVVRMVAGARAARPVTARRGTRGRMTNRRRSLLSQKFRCANYDGGHRRDLTEETASSFDLHEILLQYIRRFIFFDLQSTKLSHH